MTRAELNKAILTVLRNQFKKDAKEAHEVVKEAGYGIVKINGGFEVYNDRTNRKIYVKEGYRSYIIHGYHERQRTQLTKVTIEKFDFVGCLEKPQNRDYYEQLHNESMAHDVNHDPRINKLKSAKWHVRYTNDEVAKIQAQMEKLQKELIRAVERKVEAEQELKQVKKELGLRK